MTSTATPRANHAAASAMSNYANENYHASYLEIYAKPKVSSYSGSSSSSVYPPRHWSTTSTTSASSSSSSSSSSTSTGSSTSYHPSEALKPAHGPHASRPATTNARASDYIPRPSQPLSKPTSASKSYAAGNNSTSKISPLSAAKRIPHSPPALYPARVWTPTAADRLGCVGAPWASSPLPRPHIRYEIMRLAHTSRARARGQRCASTGAETSEEKAKVGKAARSRSSSF